MTLVAFNPFFMAYAGNNETVIVATKEKSQQWMADGTFPLVKGSINLKGTTIREDFETCYFTGIPMEGKLLKEVMDEMVLMMEHYFGQARVPFCSIPNGTRFETAIKFTYAGAYVKTGKTTAETDTNATTEVNFEPNEIVITLPTDLKPW